MPDAWTYRYTDFGEGRQRAPFAILRAAIPVSGPGSTISFSALTDTGGPITVISRSFANVLGDLVPTDEEMTLRVGGASSTGALFSVQLDLHPPTGVHDAPRRWDGPVAVIEPWPHTGTAVIFGQHGFLDAFTVTFGPTGFALEPGGAFDERFATG
ncbi:MAG TPA: hypothetical protein VFV00_08510 [Acidimicrobiales bacterium]|nr:hypothetical protein [Acidimicrobiales bacterium]